jgi:DNA-binding MarR family transcriptional regulator
MPTTAPALSSALRISVMRLARRLRAERADTSLTLTQISSLSTLDRHGPMGPGELAAHEKVQPPSMTRTLAVLEERGLVVRTAHATDRRQSVVAISDEGRRLLHDDRRRRDEWLAQRLTELTDDEVQALRAATPVLERLAGS